MIYDFSTFDFEIYTHFMVMGGIWGFGVAIILVIVPQTLFAWLKRGHRIQQD